MLSDQSLVFVIIGSSLVLFIWGRIRYDMVAMMALLACVIAGIVPAREAFAGFGHHAVVTVAAVLAISRAMRESGFVEYLTRFLDLFAKNRTFHTLALTSTVAFCSTFMNNVGALALMLPVAIQSAFKSGRSPSTILMPVSFCSLLGGLVTMIGTPPNIIISGFRHEKTGEGFSMFDFTPVGLGIALVGISFISFIGWRLLPQRDASDGDGATEFLNEEYITEVQITEQSSVIGKRLVDLEALTHGDIAVVAMERGEDRMLAPSGYVRLREGDILSLQVDTDTLTQLVESTKIELVGSAEFEQNSLTSDSVDVLEAVVTPDSPLEGCTLQNVQLHTRYGLNALGVARRGQALHERLGRICFTAGDVLLLQGERKEMPETFSALGLLPLAKREIDLIPKPRSMVAPFIFAIAILSVATGALAPQIAFVLGLGAMIFSGTLSIKDVYESIDWSVIVLLGAMIPVGHALETSGGSATIAEPLIQLAVHAPIWTVIALLILTTMLLSDIMNNAATAVLMAPIGITVANSLGASIDPFLIAVAVGSSSTYLTPIGHQSNLLVMGPGGYRFGDYWRLGLPLDLLILLVSVPLILWFWPLYQ